MSLTRTQSRGLARAARYNEPFVRPRPLIVRRRLAAERALRRRLAAQALVTIQEVPGILHGR